MKKWVLLFTILICWLALGFLLFNPKPARSRGEVELTEQASRIISTAPNITEILFELGLDERIAAVTSDSSYPSEAAGKIKIGNFWQPDIEAIIAAKPNLVVTLGFPLYPQQQNLADRLTRLGYKSLTVFNRENIDDLYDAIEKIGLATDSQRRAEALNDDIRGKLERIALLAAGKRKQRVLYVVQRNPLRVAGTDTFINEMIKLAGGQNAIGATIQKYPPISSEQLIACEADVIIEPSMGQKNTDELRESALEYWSRFINVPAVQNKRIYIVDDDAVSQLGPRLYEGVEKIALCINPSLFEDADQ